MQAMAMAVIMPSVPTSDSQLTCSKPRTCLSAMSQHTVGQPRPRGRYACEFHMLVTP